MSFHRPATRAGLSGNWRMRTDAAVRDNGHVDGFEKASDALEIQDSRESHGTSKYPGNVTMRGEDDPCTLQAIAEGRRLYVGNLSYMAKTEDVKALFGHEYDIEHINMSIDPYTGRNPSYCFVELKTRDEASKAMHELDGRNLLGRPVKIGPGVASSNRKRAPQQHSAAKQKRHAPRPVFDRWTRTDAPDHFEKYNDEGRRLWVGGLPPMGDHHSVNEGVRELFKGYEIEAVSKVIIPAQPALGDRRAWNHRYLFVDFATAEEAKHAAKAVDGRDAWDVKIRVALARGPGSRKI